MNLKFHRHDVYSTNFIFLTISLSLSFHSVARHFVSFPRARHFSSISVWLFASLPSFSIHLILVVIAHFISILRLYVCVYVCVFGILDHIRCRRPFSVKHLDMRNRFISVTFLSSFFSSIQFRTRMNRIKRNCIKHTNDTRYFFFVLFLLVKRRATAAATGKQPTKAKKKRKQK